MIASRRGLRPRIDNLDDRVLPAVSLPGLTAAQLSQAYGFSSTPATGAGQTIAIVDAFHDPNLAGDLATFDQANNLPGQTSAQVAGILTQVNQAGGATNDGWAGEEALDVEWAHAVAPGAKIVVVEARSDSLNDLMAAVNTARNLQGVSVVSMSWGGSEFPGEQSYDGYFTTPAGHTPITFVAASGDNSAFAGAEWPASSPNVVAVGGTTLLGVSSNGNPVEVAWSGSGGGYSFYESEPSYQMSVQRTGVRTTPDVSLDADPWTGMATYVTTPSTGQGSWQQIGGTSASTQVWAGLLADADQARAKAGKTTLDTSTTLTALYGAPGAFNDITRGSNGYRARTGYDLATGLGTPRVGAVITALARPGVATSISHSTATTTTIHSSAVTTTSPKAVVAPATTVTATTPATTPAVVIAAPATSTASTANSVTTSTASTAAPSVAAGRALPATAASTASGLVTQGLADGTDTAVHPIPADEPPAPPAQPPKEDRPAADPKPADGPAAVAPAEPAAAAPALPAGDAPSASPAAPGPEAAPQPVEARPKNEAGPSKPGAAPARPMPRTPSRDEEPESGRPEGAVSISIPGVALAALAGTVWRSRLQTRRHSSTPRGPRALFRWSDGFMSLYG
jgi:subtilase family serine protease